MNSRINLSWSALVSVACWLLKEGEGRGEGRSNLSS